MSTSVTYERERYCRRCGYPLQEVIGATGVGLDGLPRKCVCPECGRGFQPADPRSTADRPERDWGEELAPLARVLTICAAVLAGGALLGSFVSGFAFFLRWFGMLAVVPLAGVVLLVAIPRVPLRVRTRVLALVSVALFASIVLTGWPFRLSFALHRAALDRHVAAVRAGTAPVDAGSMWIGAMRFVNVRQLPDGTVGLQLTGGRSGGDLLVKGMPGAAQLWGNMTWEREMGGGWWLVWED